MRFLKLMREGALVAESAGERDVGDGIARFQKLFSGLLHAHAQGEFVRGNPESSLNGTVLGAIVFGILARSSVPHLHRHDGAPAHLGEA
jgi:hypothetical protein